MRDADYAQAMKRQGQRQVFIIATIVVTIGALSALPFLIVTPSIRKTLPVTKSDEEQCLRIEMLHDSLNFSDPVVNLVKFVRADNATVLRYEFSGTAYGGQEYRLIVTTEIYKDEASANEGFQRGVKRVKQKENVELGQEIPVPSSLTLDKSYVAEVIDEPLGIIGCLKSGTRVLVFHATPTGISEREFIERAAEVLQ